MKVILFGASGMVGQGVLRECLLDQNVEGVLAVGRSPVGQQHEKLEELVRSDVTDLAAVEDRLRGYDACFFCLGVSSAGMKEADYRRVTYNLTLAVAQTLARLNPGMTFIYVSGTGTDSTEKGRVMWARVGVLNLTEGAQSSDTGIVSRVLLDEDGLRVMQLTFAAGQYRSEHSTPARALVQILSGSCEFMLAGTKRTLRTGDLLHMPPAFPHAVFATESFSMLVIASAQTSL